MTMKSILRITGALTLALVITLTAAAQQAAENAASPTAAVGAATATPAEAAAAAAAESSWKTGRPITMQYYRAQDRRGINVFETTKEPGVDFTGFKLDFG